MQALIFLLALVVRAANRPADYDSDDEYIGGPRQQIRQPLINNRPPNPATGVPVAGTLDNRPSRNDAWSTRMREKVCFLLICFSCMLMWMMMFLTVLVDCSTLVITNYTIFYSYFALMRIFIIGACLWCTIILTFLELCGDAFSFLLKKYPITARPFVLHQPGLSQIMR